jgi:hypothetical protein
MISLLSTANRAVGHAEHRRLLCACRAVRPSRAHDGAAVHFIVLPQVKRGNGRAGETPAENASANKTAKDAPAKKTAAKK